MTEQRSGGRRSEGPMLKDRKNIKGQNFPPVEPVEKNSGANSPNSSLSFNMSEKDQRSKLASRRKVKGHVSRSND